MLSKSTFPCARQAIDVPSFKLKTPIASRSISPILWEYLLYLALVFGSSFAIASDDDALYWDPASYAQYDEEFKFILGPNYADRMEYRGVLRNPFTSYDLEEWYLNEIRRGSMGHPSTYRLLNFAEKLMDTRSFRIRLKAAPSPYWGHADYDHLSGVYEANIHPGMILKYLRRYGEPGSIPFMQQLELRIVALETLIHETRHLRTASWKMGHFRRQYGILPGDDLLKAALFYTGNTHTEEWISQKAELLTFDTDRSQATSAARAIVDAEYPDLAHTAGVSLKVLLGEGLEAARNEPDLLPDFDENDGEIDNPFAKCYRKAQPISALGRALNSGTGRLAVGAGVGGNLALMSLAGDAAPLVEYGMLHGQYISSLGVSAGSYVAGAAPGIATAGVAMAPLAIGGAFSAIAPTWDPYWDYRGISDQQGIMLNNRFSTISCHNVWLRGGH